MSKLIDKDKLAKVIQALDEKNKKAVQQEMNRAMGVESQIQVSLLDKAPKTHDHDVLYYSKSEVDSKLANKAPDTHSHDEKYYSKTELDGSISSLSNAIDQISSDCKDYTDEKISGLIDSAPDAMNTINELAQAIKLHNDDYVAYIATVSTSIANAKNDAEKYAVSKDNDLRTELQNKINGDIGNIRSELTSMEAELKGSINSKSDSGHLHEDVYCTEADVMEMINGVGGNGHNHNDMYYTESEIDSQQTAIRQEFETSLGIIRGNVTTLATAVQSKSDTGHKHNDLYYTKTEMDGSLTSINNALGTKASENHGVHIPNPQTANNATYLRNDNTWKKITPDDIGAAKSDHGTHVVYSTTVPKAPGTATVGSESGVSRGDHVHPAPTNIPGNANTANKLKTPVNIQIGETGKTFDGSDSMSWTLKEIGAEAISKQVIGNSVFSNKINLTLDKYQVASLSSGNEIVLPSTNKFTEINLFVKDCNLIEIKIPDNCKWRVDPNLQEGTSFMFTFIYTTQEWLAEVKIFS